MTYFPLHQTTCFFIPLVAPCKPLLAIDEERTKFVLSITPKDPSNAEMLHYKRFLKKAASASSLIPHDCENLDLEIEILQKVVAIEEYFHVTLTIPDKIEANDREVIHRLYSMITEGKYCGSCSGFTISFDLTEKWRRFICDFGEKICGFLNSMDMSAELFHQKLDFKITRMVDSMRLKNFEKTMQKLNVLEDGDKLKITFISGNEDADLHYTDMFYSEETVDGVLKSPESETINSKNV